MFSWIRPAIMKEPPEGSSIEVSARRTVVAGMVTVEVLVSGTETAPVAEMSLTSLRSLRLMRPGESTTGVKARFTPNCLNSTRDLPVVAGDRNRELAAGEEVRRLAGDRRQRRLGERAQHARLLERLQRRLHRIVAFR